MVYDAEALFVMAVLDTAIHAYVLTHRYFDEGVDRPVKPGDDEQELLSPRRRFALHFRQDRAVVQQRHQSDPADNVAEQCRRQEF